MENFSLEKVSTNYKEIIKYIDELLKSLEKEDCCNPGNVTVARYEIYNYLQNSWKKLCSRLRETDNGKTSINLEGMNSKTPDSKEFDISLDSFKGFSCSVQNNSLSLHIKL